MGTAVLGHLGEKESRTPALRGAKLLCSYYPGLQFTSPPVDGAQLCLCLVPPGKSGAGEGHESPPPSQARNIPGLVGQAVRFRSAHPQSHFSRGASSGYLQTFTEPTPSHSLRGKKTPLILGTELDSLRQMVAWPQRGPSCVQIQPPRGRKCSPKVSIKCSLSLTIL